MEKKRGRGEPHIPLPLSSAILSAKYLKPKNIDPFYKGMQLSLWVFNFKLKSLIYFPLKVCFSLYYII